MFENILGQAASDQLVSDIKGRRLAPAMLFEGPQGSGKGSSALELGRVISCEENRSWNCSCSACARHRGLLHPDLLCLGSRVFSAEIAAASNAFLRERQSSSRFLFIRSVRKLLARFNPVLWEDEPKFSKIAPLALSIEDSLDGITAEADEQNVTSLVKDAIKLESDGVPGSIPIAQIRRASYWSRLAPTGKGKLLLIENADLMQDTAKNSMLKLLEEPPENVTIVLTSSRPKVLLPTILSRLRVYRFAQRGRDIEKDVLRRVFRCDVLPENMLPGPGEGLISAYLDSFLPVSRDRLKILAAFFAASVSFRAALLLRKRGTGDLPEEVISLGRMTAPVAENAGFEKAKNSNEAIGKIMKNVFNFEIRSVYSGFLENLLDTVTGSQGGSSSPSVIGFLDLWKKNIAEAETSVLIYNMNPELALERLFATASRGMAGM